MLRALDLAASSSFCSSRNSNPGFGYCHQFPLRCRWCRSCLSSLSCSSSTCNTNLLLSPRACPGHCGMRTKPTTSRQSSDPLALLDMSWCEARFSGWPRQFLMRSTILSTSFQALVRAFLQFFVCRRTVCVAQEAVQVRVLVLLGGPPHHHDSPHSVSGK